MKIEVRAALEKIAQAKQIRTTVVTYRKWLIEAGATEEVTEKGIAHKKEYYATWAERLLAGATKERGREVPSRAGLTSQEQLQEEVATVSASFDALIKEAGSNKPKAVKTAKRTEYEKIYHKANKVTHQGRRLQGVVAFAGDGYQYPGAWVRGYLNSFPWNMDTIDTSKYYTAKELIALATNGVIATDILVSQRMPLGITRGIPKADRKLVQRSKSGLSRAVFYHLPDVAEWWYEQQGIVKYHGTPINHVIPRIGLVPIEEKLNKDGTPFLYPVRTVYAIQRAEFYANVARSAVKFTACANLMNAATVPCPFVFSEDLGRVITGQSFNAWLAEIKGMVLEGKAIWCHN